jgi:UDP-N-acetylmuramyl tripeptide synthase
MNLTKILTVILFGVSLVLGWYLYSGVENVIEERAIIESTETAIIERLRLIREAEVLFQEQNGRYTSSWDTLANFIETGRVPILQRREIIKQKAYGGEEVTIITDTLGFVSAKENIFKKNYSMNATDNGVFEVLNVSVIDVHP